MRSTKMFVFLVFIISLTLGGCGDSARPSDRTAFPQIKEWLVDQDGELYEVVSLERINGMPEGEMEYIIEAKAKLKYKKSLEQYVNDMYKQISEIDEPSLKLGIAMRGEAGTKMYIRNETRQQHGDFNAGEVKEQIRSYTFRKTEKGWQLRNE